MPRLPLAAALPFLLVVPNVVAAGEAPEICVAIAQAAAKHAESCASAAAAIDAVTDRFAANPQIVYLAGEDPACETVAEAAFKELITACKEDPAVSKAIVRLADLADAGKPAGASDAPVQPEGPTTPSVTTKKPAASKPAAPAPPDPAIVAKLCLDWAQSVKDFGDKCPALGKRLQRVFRGYGFQLRDIPRDDADYKTSLATCTEAANATAPCALDKEVRAAMKLVGN